MPKSRALRFGSLQPARNGAVSAWRQDEQAGRQFFVGDKMTGRARVWFLHERALDGLMERESEEVRGDFPHHRRARLHKTIHLGAHARPKQGT